MRRAAPALLALALAACQRSGPAPTPAAPPPDHTPAFVASHAAETGCEACHGEDACLRCHRSRPPRDHRPGFAGLPHAVEARLDPDRCATCHTGSICARCHGP